MLLTPGNLDITSTGAFYLAFMCQTTVATGRIPTFFYVKVNSEWARSHLAVTSSVTASPEECRNIWIFWEMTSKMFRIQRSAWSDGGRRSCVSLRWHLE